MTDIIAIDSVEPVMFGVVKIVWKDGYQAVVDLRPVIGEGAMFAFLRADASRFERVNKSEHGHTIFWIDDDGDEIDFGTQSLRKRAERQAEILRLAS